MTFQGPESVLKQQRGVNAWKDGKEGTGSFQGHLKGKREEPLKQGREAGRPGTELGPASVGSQWQTGTAGVCPWTLWSGKGPSDRNTKRLLAANPEVTGLAQVSVGTGDVSKVTELRWRWDTRSLLVTFAPSHIPQRHLHPRPLTRSCP